MPATVTTRHFSVEEYHRMAEAGVLHPADVIDVHQTPHDRAYAQAKRYHRGEVIRPGAVADLRLAVDEILPPPRHPSER